MLLRSSCKAVSPALRRPRQFNSLSSVAHLDNVRITTLANKVRVATIGTPSHFTTLGAYVDAGSRYESSALIGASHFLERLAFKASSISGEKTMAIADALGGQVLCATSREAIIYQISHFTGNAGDAMYLISETINNPSFLDEEIQAVKESTEYELREMQNKPEMVLPEILHQVAYGSLGLGNSIICPESRLELMDGQKLRSFMQEWYRPNRMVIAGAGIDHEELVHLAEKYFSKTISTASCSSNDNGHYMGGYHHISSDPDSELDHVYLAFKGLPIFDQDIYALAIIQVLLGGGGSFSAGGPGKGMYSRFYTNVLNQHPEIEHCAAFHHIYSDTSLFGTMASFHRKTHFRRVSPSQVLSILLMQLRLLLNAPIPEQELNRAKNQLKSSLVMALESQATEVEDLGRQVLVHGGRIPVMEMCNHIDKVSEADILRTSQKIFGKDCKAPVSLLVQSSDGINNYELMLKGQGIGYL